jgi:hypothetical protein
MKNLNILIWTNRVVMSITGILYLTIILGLYAQVVLGFTQVLSAIILLFVIKKISIENQNRITIYWGLTISYGLVYLADIFNQLESFWIIIFILIPIGIAGYFTFILESIKKEI